MPRRGLCLSAHDRRRRDTHGQWPCCAVAFEPAARTVCRATLRRVGDMACPDVSCRPVDSMHTMDSLLGAEARKSPAVDGVVNRDADGKEMRYPIILTPDEKRIARTVVLAFRQAMLTHAH